MNLLTNIFSTAGFMPHGHCYLWETHLTATMVVSDVLIGLSYVAISVALCMLVREIKVPFKLVFLAFGVFILACGTVHFLDVYTVWRPIYWVLAWVKVVTAAASVITAAYFLHVYPSLIEMANTAHEISYTQKTVAEFFREKLSTPPEVQRLFLRAILVPMCSALVMLLASVALVGYFRAMQDRVEQSAVILSYARGLSSQALAAQREFSSYLINQDPAMVQESEVNQKSFQTTWEVLKSLVKENPIASQKLINVHENFSQWQEFFQTVVKGSHATDLRKAIRTETFERNREIAEATAALMDDLLQVERDLANSQESKTKKVATISISAIALGTLLLSVIFAIYGRNALMQVTSSYGRALASERMAHERLQQALATRDEFLSIASHELKTPLTSLKLQLQMTERNLRLEGGTPDTMQLGQSVGLALRQVHSLNELVDDLLDTSKIQRGKFSVKVVEVDFSEVVQDVLLRFKDEFRLARIAVERDLQANLVGLWDPHRLEQIVVNLISNAIKYAPRAPLRVTTRSHGPTAILEVIDHGPGIPIDQHEKIFERFERVPSSKKVAGMGLGLFIAKTIVETKGGTIHVESSPGQGCKFTVELPFRHQSAEGRGEA